MKYLLLLFPLLMQTAYAETYYAHIENGIVTNVIVADQDFIDSQEGLYVETRYDGSLHGKFAEIGDHYNSTSDSFLDQPLPEITVIDIVIDYWGAFFDFIYSDNGTGSQ